MSNKDLIKRALNAMKTAYCPYSDFMVGAALITENGSIYTGCNIENCSFSATVCAERTAFFKAVSQGETKFRAIAIVGGKKGENTDFCYPCGVCRQVMSEFCNDDFEIVLYNGTDIKTYTLVELLPHNFGRDSLC